jgi:hypothetical protein
MQTGQLVVTSNSQISYDKYGRVKIRDRKWLDALRI